MRTRTVFSLLLLVCAVIAPTAVVSADEAEPSVARYWDDTMLDAIRASYPRPPVHARNLLHTSAAMYDAWATYDPVARGLFFQEKNGAPDLAVARDEAISYAAYRILKYRFREGSGPNWLDVQAELDRALLARGYHPGVTTTEGNEPAAIGNRVAATILGMVGDDGSWEDDDFVPPDYEPFNPELVFKLPGAEMDDPNRWQPLAFDFLILQNGIPVGSAIQEFVCPHWAGVTPFALRADHQNPVNGLFLDPGPPDFLGSDEFKENALELIRNQSHLDPSQNEMIDASPAAFYNNTLGTDDGKGYPVNPYTGEPYEPNVIPLADFGRIISEFWADGPDSETPPGHWHVVANDTSDAMTEFRIAGRGPVVDRLQWDVKLYVAMAGAAHDAAIAAWGAKGYYDYSRPISHIRYMADLGQSTDRHLPNYHPDGLPLVDGLVELVTELDLMPGGRAEEFPERIYEAGSGEPIGVDTHVGDLMVKAWLGGYSAGAVSLDPAAGATIPGRVFRTCDGSWDFSGFAVEGDDTPGAVNLPDCSPVGQILINEIRLAQPGPDVDEYVELIGPAGASLDGYTYVVVGSEVVQRAPSPQGRIQLALDLSGHVIGDDGLFLIGEPTLTIPAEVDLVAPLNFRDVENTTHLLVADFTGYLGQDADFFDVGILDVTPWRRIRDSVAIVGDLNDELGLYSDDQVGPDQARDQIFGVGWVLADRWMPYQASNFVTPPFAGYVSGHSCFSRATAEALAQFTGSKYFPGGLGTYTFPAHEWLKFEDGPSETITLQWATYFDAADEAALSRRWGGIHPVVDDLRARKMGAIAGRCAVARLLAVSRGWKNSPDIDCSGAIDNDDLTWLLDEWGECEDCPSDINGDLEVDDADLAILLREGQMLTSPYEPGGSATDR